MPSRIKPYYGIILAVVTAACVGTNPVVAGTGRLPPPVPAPLARAAAGRTPEQQATAALEKVLVIDSRKLADLVRGTPPEALFTDAALRAKIAVQAKPLLWDIVTRTDRFSRQYPAAAARLRYLKFHYLALLELFGDAQASQALNAALHSGSKTTVIAAQLSRLVVQWAADANNVADQQAILGQVDKLVKLDPCDDDITLVVYTMARGAANKALASSARHMLLHQLKGPLAQHLQAFMSPPPGHGRLMNKPLVLRGTTLAGQPFSTAAWKGKVVFIDFWATWCPPCRASVPHDEALYGKYHHAGLEIVGVSNDNSATPLRAFLKQHPKMVWPELFEPGQHGWSPISAKYNVQAIPTQFILDRQGVLRYVVVGYDPGQVERDVASLITGGPAPQR